MTRLTLMLICAGLLAYGVDLNAQGNSETETEFLTSTNLIMNNKEKVGAFLGAVLTGDTATMRELANADYIQHNPFIPTGLEPFIQLLPVLQENGTTAENVRMFEDGNFVFMHNIWRNASPFGADEMVSFDIIRLDDQGNVAEHWDAMTALVFESASGRSQTDGPTAVTDLDQTQENKELARAFVEDLLMGKNPQKISEYISANQYDQHNPAVKDGLSGVIEAVEYLTSQNNMFKYSKIHKVLGEGNFVLTVSEGEWNGKAQVFYDLFRVENAQLVEHWDVIQEIPTENLANDNTMFGFE